MIAFSAGRYQVFGETIDVAVGNCLDRVARTLRLPNDPAPGLHIEWAAERAVAAAAPALPPLAPLPYVVKGMDVSFASLVDRVEQLHAEGQFTVDQLCYAMQETAFAALIEVSERAMAHVGAEHVLLVGGVGCNKRLQKMMGEWWPSSSAEQCVTAEQMCEARGATVCATDERFCIDNGAMIAYTGGLMADAAYVHPARATFTQRYRTDDVAVTWRL